MPDSPPLPLWHQLQRSAQRSTLPLHTPGHKQGRGILPEVQAAWGAEVFRYDLPELPGLDNLLAPEGVIAEAQALAAETFHADRSWFLVNGSTVGILAALLAIVPQKKILLPRTVHRSAIAGLVLSGAQPVFVTPVYDATWDCWAALDPQRLAEGLAAHPDCGAVFLVSPTYEGLCADVGTIATLCHEAGIPLIVDEAHGAHFGFHPQLPPRALDCGADVVVQSAHKTLGALTQSALLHLRGSLVSPHALQGALNLLHTTSPSYLLLASLDAARHQMATAGEVLWERVLAAAAHCREGLRPHLPVFCPETVDLPIFAWDPSRLTIATASLGLTGFAMDEILNDRYGILAELVQAQRLTFLFGLGQIFQEGDRLLQACLELGANSLPQATFNPLPSFDPTLLPRLTTPACSPQKAYFSPQKMVPWQAAIGQISAELVCPYPPGIPALLPGEVITAAAIDCLHTIQHCGGTIVGHTDPTLVTLRILEI